MQPQKKMVLRNDIENRMGKQVELLCQEYDQKLQFLVENLQEKERIVKVLQKQQKELLRETNFKAILKREKKKWKEGMQRKLESELKRKFIIYEERIENLRGELERVSVNSDTEGIMMVLRRLEILEQNLNEKDKELKEREEESEKLKTIINQQNAKDKQFILQLKAKVDSYEQKKEWVSPDAKAKLLELSSQNKRLKEELNQQGNRTLIQTLQKERNEMFLEISKLKIDLKNVFAQVGEDGLKNPADYSELENKMANNMLMKRIEQLEEVLAFYEQKNLGKKLEEERKRYLETNELVMLLQEDKKDMTGEIKMLWKENKRLKNEVIKQEKQNQSEEPKALAEQNRQLNNQCRSLEAQLVNLEMNFDHKVKQYIENWEKEKKEDLNELRQNVETMAKEIIQSEKETRKIIQTMKEKEKQAELWKAKYESAVNVNPEFN